MNIRNHVNKIKIGAVVCSILSLILLCPCERVSAYEINDLLNGGIRAYYASPKINSMNLSGSSACTQGSNTNEITLSANTTYGICAYGSSGEVLGGWGGGQIYQFTFSTENNTYIHQIPEFRYPSNNIARDSQILDIEMVARTDGRATYRVIGRLTGEVHNGYGIPIPIDMENYNGSSVHSMIVTGISLIIWWGAVDMSNSDIVNAINSLDLGVDLTETNEKIDNINNTIQNRYEEEDNATEDAQSNAQSGAEDAGQQATEDAGNLIQGAQALINALNTSTGTDCIISGNLYDGIFNLGNLNLCLNKPSWWDNIANIVGSLVFAPAIYWWGRRVLEKMLTLYDRMQK